MGTVMKKTFIIIILLLAVLVGVIAVYTSRPKEVYFDGEELADGTMLYEDSDMTVVADWNYSEGNND